MGEAHWTSNTAGTNRPAPGGRHSGGQFTCPLLPTCPLELRRVRCRNQSFSMASYVYLLFSQSIRSEG